MLDRKTKDRVIKKYKTHDSDTGSTQVQVAILTEEIKQLTEHLKEHKKDFSSRRGLLRKVSERRKLLKYLQREDDKEYEDIIKALKIKTIKPVDESKAKEEERAAKKLKEEEAEKNKLAAMGQ